MRTLTLAAVLLVGRSAVAGCDPGRLEPTLVAAEEAFAGGDPSAVVKAFSKVRRALSCAEVALTPQVCARVHRASALTHWIEGDDAGTWLALRAMRHADPTLDLPNLAPEHPILHQLVLAEEAPMAWAPSGAKTAVLVDGLRTGVVPVEQPYVLQALDEDGTPQKPRLVERLTSRADDPGQPVAPIAKALRWTSLGLGAGAAGLYGAAWGTNSAYRNAVEARDDGAIGSLHAATNGLAIGSAALTTLAAGALLGAEATKR